MLDTNHLPVSSNGVTFGKGLPLFPPIMVPSWYVNLDNGDLYQSIGTMSYFNWTLLGRGTLSNLPILDEQFTYADGTVPSPLVRTVYSEVLRAAGTRKLQVYSNELNSYIGTDNQGNSGCTVYDTFSNDSCSIETSYLFTGSIVRGANGNGARVSNKFGFVSHSTCASMGGTVNTTGNDGIWSTGNGVFFDFINNVINIFSAGASRGTAALTFTTTLWLYKVYISQNKIKVKIWDAATAEPSAWTTTVTTPGQQTGGILAVYSTLTVFNNYGYDGHSADNMRVERAIGEPT